jgi:hypothetical protein
MKKMKKLIAVAIAALFLASTAALAVDAPKGAQKVSHFGGEKAPVTFNHDTHVKGMKCADCHHNEKDGKYKCGDCHKAEAAGKAPSMKDAAHAKETGVCWGCHNKNSAKVQKEMKCGDCHKE